MERKKIANVIVPAAAVAGLIALAAIVIVAGNPDEPTKKGPHGQPVPAKTGDQSSSGMSDKPPPVESAEWQDIGSGLKIWDVKVGEGPEVKAGETVTAHYIGWLTDGTVFDSSVKRGEPTQFSLNGVVVGWQRGIPGMKPGGIRRLYIPSDLAYGPGGRPGIPPNAPLIFEVKLISSP